MLECWQGKGEGKKGSHVKHSREAKKKKRVTRRSIRYTVRRRKEGNSETAPCLQERDAW